MRNLDYQIIKDGKVIFDSSDNTDDNNTVYPLITLETTQSDENDENSSYETILISGLLFFEIPHNSIAFIVLL